MARLRCNVEVSNATKAMNVLEIVRRQAQRKEAVKQAQLVQLTYRGNKYTSKSHVPG